MDVGTFATTGGVTEPETGAKGGGTASARGAPGLGGGPPGATELEAETEGESGFTGGTADANDLGRDPAGATGPGGGAEGLEAGPAVVKGPGAGADGGGGFTASTASACGLDAMSDATIGVTHPEGGGRGGAMGLEADAPGVTGPGGGATGSEVGGKGEAAGASG